MSADSLFNELLNDMEKKIAEKIYVEGEKLPSERKLSEHYNISRNIVRQVLATLKEKGFIEIIPSKGAYVTSYNEDKLKESLEMLVGKYDASIQDILEAREALECVIVQHAVQKRTVQDIEKLKTLCKKMNDEDELIKFLSMDLEFHKLLAEATQNKILCILVQSFYELTDNFPFTVTQYNVEFLNIIEKARKEHWALIDAIESQNLDLATTIIKEHMISFKKELEFFKNRSMT